VPSQTADPSRVSTLPVALAIAGLDPSGGAGLVADIRAFEACGVFAAAACAVLTVQSTRGLVEAVAVDSELLARQVLAVLEDAPVASVKIGATGSLANAERLALLLAAYPASPVVVDPVMAPTRGSSGLDGGTRGAAARALAPLATILTPNVAEAENLGAQTIRGEADAREAAVALLSLGARAVLLKGGHLGGAEAVDFLATAGGVTRIARPRRALPEVHGTGCVLSSLLAGRLAALGLSSQLDDRELLGAVRWARNKLDRALAAPLREGHGQLVLRPRP
jgi:hydroxymethylpyrimidine/phosphomethylpyrimidine kinase